MPDPKISYLDLFADVIEDAGTITFLSAFFFFFSFFLGLLSPTCNTSNAIFKKIYQFNHARYLGQTIIIISFLIKLETLTRIF